MSEVNELMDVVKQTAFNVAGISEQMGILNSRVLNIEKEQRRLSEQQGSINNRMQKYEDRIRLDRPQAQNLKQAIHARVKNLLGIRYENGIVATECLRDDKYYRPGFISRCYADARKDSRLGTPYYETYQRDYEEVLEFINNWLPPVGVEAYKVYLDARRNR